MRVFAMIFVLSIVGCDAAEPRSEFSLDDVGVGGFGGADTGRGNTCGSTTRCTAAGDVCRWGETAFDTECVPNTVPIGESCEADEECVGDEGRGYCIRPLGVPPGGPGWDDRYCAIFCAVDADCPLGMTCEDTGGNAWCI